MGCNVETYSGLFLDYEDPRAEQVTVRDIAHALSNTCRFGGHVLTFYSVAEHAVYVAELVENSWPNASPDFYLAALHHDSHEAYMGDVPTPLKRQLGPAVAALADRIDVAIGEALGVRPHVFKHGAIKEADTYALRVEANALLPSRGTGPEWGTDTPLNVPRVFGLQPRDASDLFLATHERYTT